VECLIGDTLINRLSCAKDAVAKPTKTQQKRLDT